MSDNYIEAANDARALLRGFRGLERVAAALDKVANLSRAETETTQRLEVLADKEVVVTALLQSQLRAAEDSRNTALSAIAQANQQSAEIVEQAKVEAAKVVEDAKDEAARYRKEVIDGLHKELAAIRTAHTETLAVELANHNARLDAVKAKIKALATTLGEQA